MASASTAAGRSGTATAGCAPKRLPDNSPVLPDGSVDLTVEKANTSVIAHGGKILALVESGFPHVLSPELETLGFSPTSAAD